MPNYSFLRVCCQCIKFKMDIIAETCSFRSSLQYPCTNITLPIQSTRDVVHPSKPNRLPLYTRRMPKYSCLQVCCQSVNLKMAMRAETCSFTCTHTPPSLLNTHEISYPHATQTPLCHTQDACESIAV